VYQNVFPAHHKHAGKRVFIVTFTCTYVSGDPTLSEEHDNFVWVNKNNYHDVNDGTSYFEMLETYFNLENKK
jgi:hypothetical protein